MKKKKFFSFSFYFWIAFVLLMTSLFFINRAIIGKAITKIKDSPSFSHTEIINNTVKETLESSPLKEMPSLEDDKEKFEALELLMDHYHPGKKAWFNPAAIPRTAVYKLVVEEFTAKRKEVKKREDH